MSHLVRGENSQEARRERNPQLQAVPVTQRPDPIRKILVVRERPYVAVEIVLQVCADGEPQPPFGRLYRHHSDLLAFGIKDLVVERRRIFRHENDWPRTVTPASHKLACWAPGQTLVDGLQLFSRLEAHGFAGGNIDLGSGARIAADARLARAHVEHAKAAQFNALALAQRFFHAGENRLYRQLSFGFGYAGLVHYFIDDIELYHESALLKIDRGDVTCR